MSRTFKNSTVVYSIVLLWLADLDNDLQAQLDTQRAANAIAPYIKGKTPLVAIIDQTDSHVITAARLASSLGAQGPVRWTPGQRYDLMDVFLDQVISTTRASQPLVLVTHQQHIQQLLAQTMSPIKAVNPAQPLYIELSVQSNRQGNWQWLQVSV